MYIQISYPFIFINYLRQAQTTQKMWLNFTVKERFPRSTSQPNMCLLWTLILVKYEQSATWCESRAVTDAIMFSNLFGIIATVWYYPNDQVELIQPITVQMVWTEKSYHLREFLALIYVRFFVLLFGIASWPNVLLFVHLVSIVFCSMHTAMTKGWLTRNLVV